MKSNVGVILGAALLTACNSAPAANNKLAQTNQTKGGSIEGYGGVKFGSSFMDAIGTLGGEMFNPVAVSECFQDLPLKGCYLSSNTDGALFEVRDGVPYKLTLSFNRYDKLTDIGLSYSREGDISKADCLSIHERTLDWLAREYGQLRFPEETKPSTELRKTAGGIVYQVWQDEKGSLISSPMRTVTSPVRTGVEEEPIPNWNNDRYVSLLSHFIIVNGTPMCEVGVDFKEPKSVERPKLE